MLHIHPLIVFFWSILLLILSEPWTPRAQISFSYITDPLTNSILSRVILCQAPNRPYHCNSPPSFKTVGVDRGDTDKHTSRPHPPTPNRARG